MNKLLIPFLFLITTMIQAQVVWYGDPNKSVNTSFRRFDRGNYPQDVCNGGDGSTQSSAGTVNDPVYGKVWRIHKPKKRKRGEFARTSYIPKKGETLYYGWRWKITSTPDVTGGIAVFQWKAAGTTNNTQNYPFNLGYGGGTLTMNAYGPCYPTSQSCGSRAAQGVKIWSKPVKENEWVTIVIGMHLSTDKSKGWVELWFNGEKQILGNLKFDKYKIQKFSTDKKRAYHKTWDGEVPYPKWGSYNQNACSFETYTYYDEMRIGKDAASVMAFLGGGIVASDEIDKLTAPSSVEQGETISIDVDYEASSTRDIVAMFQLDESPWTTYEQVIKSVNAGSGTVNIDMTIPLTTLAADDAYQFQVFMAPTGKHWEDRFSNKQVIDVDVTAPEVKEPYYGVPTAIPGILEMEAYDKGGPDVSYYDTNPENKGAEESNFRVDDGVDIGVGNNGYVLGWTSSSEWLEYTIDVDQTSEYNWTIVYSSLNGGGELGVDLDGSILMSEITIPSTGDWDSYNQIVEKIPLPAGEHVLRFHIESNGFNLDNINFEKAVVLSDQKLAEKGLIEVFPNPSVSGFFNLNGLYDFELYSLSGVLILDERADQVDLTNHPCGVYTMNVGGQRMMLVK